MTNYIQPIQIKPDQSRLHRLIHKYVQNEIGAISVDHIVLTAGVVIIGLLAISNYSSGAKTLANDRKQTLSSYRGISSSATNPKFASTTGTGGTGGGTTGTGGGTTGTGGGTTGTGGGTTGTDPSTTGTGTTDTDPSTGGTDDGTSNADDDSSSSDDSESVKKDNSDDDSSSGSTTNDDDSNSGSGGEQSSFNDLHDYDYLTGGTGHDVQFV